MLPLCGTYNFFTMSLWQHIIQTTNKYAWDRLQNMAPRRRSVKGHNIGWDEGFHWHYNSDGLGKTIRNKGLLVDTLHLELPFFRIIFSRDCFCGYYMLVKHLAQLSAIRSRAISWQNHPSFPETFASIQTAFYRRVHPSVAGLVSSIHPREATTLGDKGVCIVREQNRLYVQSSHLLW